EGVRDLLVLEDLDVVDDRALVDVQADGEEFLAVGGGVGHPQLLAQDDRRRPALTRQRPLPRNVLLLAPLGRQPGGLGNARAIWSAKLRPGVIGEGEGRDEEGQEQEGSHGGSRGKDEGGRRKDESRQRKKRRMNRLCFCLFSSFILPPSSLSSLGP